MKIVIKVLNEIDKAINEIGSLTDEQKATYSRRPVPSTDQAIPSCFNFRIL